jgi:coenzyme F420-reducing hydrogenase beta subunit
MIILYKEKKECCGCSACVNICPQQAISMIPDEDGFLFPVINHALCIECGLCKKVCAFQNNVLSEKKPISTYAAKHRNEVLLQKSSSGGVFPALAAWIVEKEGVVFGCSMDDNLEPCHVYVKEMEALASIQGSKYIQSDLKQNFSEVKEFLESGKYVLFTGTPCQIDGLKSFLSTDYKNLITADLICHGVPSVSFFKEYIRWFEKKHDAKVIQYKFRDKSKTGMGVIPKIEFLRSGKLFEKHIYCNLDVFMSLFEYGKICRECCYSCKYASEHRISDFTLGDYWGIEIFHPEVSTKDGVSVLLINSDKGKKILDDLDLDLYVSSFDKASAFNANLIRPTTKTEDHDFIMALFRENGFDAVADYFKKTLGLKAYLYYLKSQIPNSMKKNIRMFLQKSLLSKK